MPYNRFTPGSGCRAGWASEAVILLLVDWKDPVTESRADNITAGEGRAATSSMRSCSSRRRSGECRFG